jgi:predicted outer membrane repeat protein
MRNLALGILSASLMSALAAIPAAALTITTSAGCTLAEAIESANTNTAVGGCTTGAAGRDRIVVALNETLSAANNDVNGLPVVIEDLIITAVGNPRAISRSYTVGTPNFRFLEIGTGNTPANVTISNMLLANGRVTGAVNAFGLGGPSGGCIFLRNGGLKIEDSTIQECVAEGDDNAAGNGGNASGGAIYAVAGTIEIRNSSIVLNNAYGGDATAAGFVGGAGEGGAIRAGGLASFVVEDTTFSSNFAVGGAGVSTAGTASGGALVLIDSTGSIDATSFSANAVSGGAASGGDSALGKGGAVSLSGVTLTMTDVDLVQNVANGGVSATARGGYASGGALHVSASTLTCETCEVAENRVLAGNGIDDPSDGIATGGGLYLLDTTATLDRTIISSNSVSGAVPFGGAIDMSSNNATDETVLITHGTIAYNAATASHSLSQGGAIRQSGDILTIRNTAVSDNAADDGGALFQEKGRAQISLSTLSANHARHNGGAIALDTGLEGRTVELTNATVSGNSADLNGGGIYVKGTPLSPDAATLTLANSIVTNGTNGGIYLAEGLTQPVLDSGNSIVGAQASGADCTVSGAAILTTNGGNLESGTTCGFTHTADRQSVGDLGLASLGDNGGETLTHALLAASPAIDGGRQRICNRDANKKDQRGLARFYDGNSDREFACDSGPVEYQGLLANPGFEQRLDGAGDWTLIASGGGDGRVPSTGTPNGKFALIFQANSALETISQSRPVAGNTGETFTLTMLGEGAGLTVGEGMKATVETLSGGTVVDTQTCATVFKAATLSGAPAACVLATTAAYDTVRITIGWKNATTGSITLDAITLTQG